ncbi:MAG TPA: GNAT family N-acetyltransferase [Myxococcota bacterium]
MLSALDVNYLEASRIFVSHADTGEYRERKDVVIVSCGLPVETLNFGFLRPPYAHLGTTAAAVQAYFEGRKLRFQLALREDGTDRSIQRLESEGWRRKPDPTPGMTLAMPAAEKPPPPPLVIQQVRTQDQIVAFREAAFLGFGYPVAAAHIFLGDPVLGLPQVRLYSGLVDGAVVATSMLIATGAVAGIYWVATLEEHRGRGYGEALTAAAVAGGRDFGCRIASLQASKLGRPVYQRMGFEHVLDYVSLLPPTD